MTTFQHTEDGHKEEEQDLFPACVLQRTGPRGLCVQQRDSAWT